MSNRKTNESENENSQSYKAIAIVFSVAGLAFILSESTRATGIPFLVLGITFFAISQQDSSNQQK